MKTRNGLVSNSSSSSFIVAFPRKPKNKEDVLQFMFDGKEGGVSLPYYDNGLSYNQVSERVFDRISKESRKATLKNLIETIRGRYYYTTNIGCTVLRDTPIEPDGGCWSYEKSRYFCSDENLANKLKKETILHDTKRTELNDRQRSIITQFGPREVEYAYKGGVDYRTKNQYTRKQIDLSENYFRELEEFKRTNLEYIKYEKDLHAFWRTANKTLDMLVTKLAKADIKNFLEDHKGSFIFITEFSDSDGSEDATMEHADIFRNVPRMIISNH